MFFALVCFILGSALCGAAQNMKWLIAARSEFNTQHVRRGALDPSI